MYMFTLSLSLGWERGFAAAEEEIVVLFSEVRK